MEKTCYGKGTPVQLRALDGSYAARDTARIAAPAWPYRVTNPAIRSRGRKVRLD